MVSILADDISPNAGGAVEGSQPMSTAFTWSPNKLWRSNSIFTVTYGLSVDILWSLTKALSCVRAVRN
jgi:hypothetical protein